MSWHKKSWLVNQRKEDQICSIFPLCISIVEISWILSTRETARAYQLCAFALCCNLSLRSDTFFLLINQPALFHLFHESICRNRNCRNCALSQYLEPYVAGVWLIYRLTLSWPGFPVSGRHHDQRHMIWIGYFWVSYNQNIFKNWKGIADCRASLTVKYFIIFCIAIAQEVSPFKLYVGWFPIRFLPRTDRLKHLFHSTSPARPNEKHCICTCTDT